MIGADEFNSRKSQSSGQSASDTSDIDFIETFFAASRKDQIDSGLLIDIVCPQPPSQRGIGRSKANQATEKRSQGVRQ